MRINKENLTIIITKAKHRRRMKLKVETKAFGTIIDIIYKHQRLKKAENNMKKAIKNGKAWVFRITI